MRRENDSWSIFELVWAACGGCVSGCLFGLFLIIGLPALSNALPKHPVPPSSFFETKAETSVTKPVAGNTGSSLSSENSSSVSSPSKEIGASNEKELSLPPPIKTNEIPLPSPVPKKEELPKDSAVAMWNRSRDMARNQETRQYNYARTPSPKSVEAPATHYIGNKHTKVFHNESCRYVRQMVERNMLGTDDREELINKGYRPCKVCKP